MKQLYVDEVFNNYKELEELGIILTNSVGLRDDEEYGINQFTDPWKRERVIITSSKKDGKKQEYKITERTLIGAITRKYPQTKSIFFGKYQMGCAGCGVSNFETIKEGAGGHGYRDLENLLDDLNEVIKK